MDSSTTGKAVSFAGQPSQAGQPGEGAQPIQSGGSSGTGSQAQTPAPDELEQRVNRIVQSMTDKLEARLSKKFAAAGQPAASQGEAGKPMPEPSQPGGAGEPAAQTGQVSSESQAAAKSDNLPGQAAEHDQITAQALEVLRQQGEPNPDETTLEAYKIMVSKGVTIQKDDPEYNTILHDSGDAAEFLESVRAASFLKATRLKREQSAGRLPALNQGGAPASAISSRLTPQQLMEMAYNRRK